LGNKFDSWHRLAQIVGLAFMLAPLIVVLAFLLAKWIGVVTGGGSETQGRRHQLATLRPFSFLAKDQVVETETSSTERGEPTSVEFERIFSEILRASLGDTRRLLIVLDNLDRVDESDGRKVLSTMQTFTGIAQLQGESWSSRVWT
jgi:hypothetical protein